MTINFNTIMIASTVPLLAGCVTIIFMKNFLMLVPHIRVAWYKNCLKKKDIQLGQF